MLAIILYLFRFVRLLGSGHQAVAVENLALRLQLAAYKRKGKTNLNAFAERWVRSVKEECLSKLILFGEGSLARALIQFQEHYLFERNHQGKGNILLFPKADPLPTSYGPSIECQQRLGGLLRYYYRRAA